jgi:hypothetical protein
LKILEKRNGKSLENSEKKKKGKAAQLAQRGTAMSRACAA